MKGKKGKMERKNFWQKVAGILSQYRGLSKSAYVLFFARLVTSMGAFIFPMLTLILTVKLGYNMSYAGVLMAIVSILMLSANLIGGKLADKFNRKKMIIILDVISVFFFFACAIVQPREIMIYFLVASGFFATMEGPAFEALIAEATLPAEREKVFSLAYLGFNLGFAFGAAIAGLLFTNYLSLAFILDGATTLSSTILIILFVKIYKQDEIKEVDKNEYEDHHDDKKSIFKILGERKSIIYFVLISSIGAFIYQQWTFTLPDYVTSIFGDELGAKYYGLLSSANGITVIVLTPIITYVLRKKYELEKMTIGAFLLGISFIIIFKANLLFLFFIFIFVFTLAEVINTVGSAPYMSRRVPGSHRGRLSAVTSLGYFFGANISMIICGFIIDNLGYDYVIGLLVILGIIEAVLIFSNLKLDRKIFPKLYITPPSMMKTSIMMDKEVQV